MVGQKTHEIPGYRLEELIHESATSAVYKGVRLEDGAGVVVKCSQRGLTAMRQHTRARNEYQILRSIDSAGVIKIRDLIAHEGRLSLIFEEFPGIPLKEWIRSGTATLAEKVEVGAEIASILAEVHRARIVHQDINSHNVLYDPRSRRCKLIDFGLATQLRSEDSRLQLPGSLEGTLAYIAPEQTGRTSRGVDHRADLYSLGITLYELFSGELPFNGTDPLDIVHFHIAGRPTPLWERAETVPEAVSNIVMKLLEKAPERRYQSAAGVEADLRRCTSLLTDGGRVETFELGSQDAIGRFELPRRLYGRRDEIERLTDAFQRVSNGGVETVVVAGQAGAGKTLLVQEIQEPIARKKGYFAAGRFAQQRGTPFSAFVGAMQALVEQLLTESEDAIVRWREAIQTAVGANGRVIVDVVPSLELIIGPQPDVPDLELFEAQNRFNLVLQGFIQVFGKKAHPLVLLLDDMQWADQASLNLVTLILSAPATESLLVVQAYRSGEDSAAHALTAAIEEQKRLGVTVGEIELEPLAPGDIVELVADTLQTDAEQARPLAEVIHAKTLGNPFSIGQLLQSLHDTGLISFNSEKRSFDYDLAAVQTTEIAENVAELLAAKLEGLAEETREALRIAAAIGGQFDIDTLASIRGQPVPSVLDALRPALGAGLIVPASALESLDPDSIDAPLGYRRFDFLHDRVQHAAYLTIPEEQLPELHLAIGRALAKGSGMGQRETRLFDVVHHMVRGAQLIDDPDEKLRLAMDCCSAGKKARKATAYELAVRFYRNAIELLGPSGWRTHPDSTFEAHHRLAESLVLNNDQTAALEVIGDADAEAASLSDRGKLKTLKIVVFMSQSKIPEALACGREALELLGVELPADAEATARMLETDVARILARTAEIGVDNLLDLPRATDESIMVTMEALNQCLPAAFQRDQQQYALLCCKMVQLSLDHGNCPLSARAYGSFGALLSTALGDHAGAYRFTKLGVDLAHKLNDPSVLSAVYFLWAMFASHWTKPIDESIELFQKSVQFGVQHGDHQHSAYAIARCMSHEQFRGKALAELRQDMVDALDLLDRIGDAANVTFLLPRLQLVDWLRGDRPRGNTLGSTEQDEETMAAAVIERGNRSFEADWFVMLTIQRCLARDFEAAREFAQKAEDLIPFSAAFITRPEHNFYYSLTLASLATSAGPVARGRYLAKIEENQSMLRDWAARCPENLMHMSLLIEAERARIAGTRIEAMDLYDKAIAASVQQGFVNIEAIAAERAAEFWYAANKTDFGDIYLDRALQAYRLWGAFGKAEDLRRAYRGGVPEPAAGTSGSNVATRGFEHGNTLDLAAVLKSSQTIAGEIRLDRLLATMIEIILANAGGEFAALILKSEDDFLIQGLKTPEIESAQVMLARPLNRSSDVSRGIVNYVIRTREEIVLEDPVRLSRFRNDPYVKTHKPKSVLCAPIVRKGELSGVIYLENNQVSGAFTPERLESLNVLLGQIAVSIENATLYAQQERQTQEIETANIALTKEVGERRRAEQELSRYKDHLEELVAKRTEEVDERTKELAEANRKLQAEAEARERTMEQLAESNEQVRALAYQDGLTNLPNRRLLNEHLEKVLARANRKSIEFAVLFVDLDNFKLINDTIGHQAADEVLRRLAASLNDLIRSEDVLALYADRNVDLDTTLSAAPLTDSVLSRFGGDEFVVLLPEIRDRFTAGAVARRILQRLDKPFQIGDQEVFVSVSVGIATYPADGHTTEILIRNADTAMYHAKQQGKSGYQYYSATMNAASVERMTLEGGLRRALADNQLELHYQPLIDAYTGTIVGAEALLRWNHPERGYVAPGTFIPIAEDTGLIIPIGDWVLEQACRQVAEWQASGLPPITMSVNVSAVQFRRQDLYELVRSRLSSSGVDPSQLVLEITESAIMSVRDRAVKPLNQLRELNVGLALDDFGTGYSSLSYLNAFPLTILKIERSFVGELLRDKTAAKITEAIISMAHVLNLKVVAEGVEQSAQLALLKELGCDIVQGFYFSRPVPAAEFADLLRADAASGARVARAGHTVSASRRP